MIVHRIFIACQRAFSLAMGRLVIVEFLFIAPKTIELPKPKYTHAHTYANIDRDQRLLLVRFNAINALISHHMFTDLFIYSFFFLALSFGPSES